MSEEKSVPLLPGEGVVRCPAIRSLIKDGKLKHDNLTTAAVHDLVGVLSGTDRDRLPHEPGSLANVARFFAIHNHGVPSSDLFDLRLFRSKGDHPGTVNFFKDDEDGVFQAAQFDSVTGEVSDGKTLTIGDIAKMITMANDGRWDKEKGTTVDLVKSAGEWALMVCVLRTSPATDDISVADLRRLYSQADSRKLLEGAATATALDWINATIRIIIAIGKRKIRSAFGLAAALHTVFRDINDSGSPKLCPCEDCNPEAWTRITSPEP